MPDYNINGLDHRSFEHLIQALSKKEIANGVTPFGDGPDGGREATFDGKMNYPSLNAPWGGYLVIQSKFKQYPTENPKDDGNWLIGQLSKELRKFTDAKRNLRRPEFYLATTNIRLSSKAETGARDRLGEFLQNAGKQLNLKGWDIWGFDDICRFLDNNFDVRQAFAHLTTSGGALQRGMLNSGTLEAILRVALETKQQLARAEEFNRELRLDWLKSAVKKGITEHRLEVLRDPAQEAEWLAQTAIDALDSISFPQRAAEIGGAAAVLEDLKKRSASFGLAADVHRKTQLKTLQRAASWSYAIGEVRECEAILKELISLSPSDFDAHSRLGALNLVRSENTAAIDSFEAAFQFAGCSSKQKFEAKYGLGMANLQLGKLAAAETEFTEAVSYAEHAGDENGHFQALAYLAWVRHKQGRRHEAIQFLQKAISLGEKLADGNDTGECYCHLGLVYSELNRFAEAEEMHRKSLEWRRKEYFVPGIAAELRNIASLCYRRNAFADAEVLFSESLEYYERLDDHVAQAEVSEMLATISARWKHWPAARDWADRATEEWSLCRNAEREAAMRKWLDEIVVYLESIQGRATQ